MSVSRRNFLKLTSLSVLGAVACNFFPEREFISQSPVHLPEDLVTGTDNWYATLCKQCAEAEGIVVRVMEGRAKKVQGNPLYPTNLGAHSVRCEAGLQALYHPERIAGPLVKDPVLGTLQPIGWDAALDLLRGKLQELSDRRAMLMVTGPLRGNLALLVDRFSKVYGGRHLAFEAMEEAAFHKVTREMLGQQVLPTFDIRNSQYLLSFGADFLSTWTSPVQFARNYGEFRQGEGRERGTFVQVDPRFSMTAANADEWIPIRPGYEGKLALSIAHVIISEGLADDNVIQDMTNGEGAAVLQDFAPDKVAQEIGIPEGLRHRGRRPADVIKDLARDFASHRPKSLAIGGGSAAAHTNGLFNLQAIYALNFLVGSVGQKGGILFNPPPPLKELATKLQVGTAADWRDFARDIEKGDIKVLLVHGANPVQGLPSAIDLRSAFKNGNPFVVSFSSFKDETTELADLALPVRVSLEDWGDDVPDPGPGYEIIGIQQPMVNPLPDLNVPYGFADLLLILAQELGINDTSPLNKDSFLEVLRDSAQKLHQLNRGSVRESDFETFWNRLLQQGGWWDKEARGPATTPPPPKLKELLKLPEKARNPQITGPEGDSIFYLVPFQSLSLTDGRGSHLPWLQATPDPVTSATWTTWIEMNTEVAKEMGLDEGDIVAVEGLEGVALELPVYCHPAVPPGVVSIPVGQSNTSGIQYAKDRGQNLLARLPLKTDPETGALAWASNRVRITSTGRSTKLSKFEGIVPAFAVNEEEAIVKVTRG